MSAARPPADPPGPADPDEGPWPAEQPSPPPPGQAWPSRIEPGGVLPEEDDEEAPWPPPREAGDQAPPAEDDEDPAGSLEAQAAHPPWDQPEPAPPPEPRPSTPPQDDEDEEAPWPAQPAPAAGPTPLRPLQPRRPRRPVVDATPADPQAWEEDDQADPVEPSQGRGDRGSRPPRGARSLTALALGLAAAVLYLGDAWWQSTAPGFAELVRIEHLPLPGDLDQTSNDPALDLRLQGLGAYGQGRWQEAEQILTRAAPQLADRHPELGLYLASALLHLGRFDEAEVEALAAAGPGDLQGEAWWLAVQARLSQEPPDLAGSYELLGQLIDQRRGRAEDARRLRQALDERR